MLAQVSAAAPPDPRHGRHVQSGDRSSTATTSIIATRPSASAGSTYYRHAGATGSRKPRWRRPIDPRVRPDDLLRLRSGPAGRSRHGAAEAATTSCTSATTGGDGGRWRASCCPPSSRYAISVGEIGFIGLWWDEPPPEGPAAGPEDAFHSDPEAFRRLRHPHRHRGHVPRRDPDDEHARASTSSRSGPCCSHLKHLTLKYFEIFYADTIPLLMLDADLAHAVYGPAARELRACGTASPRNCSTPCIARITTASVVEDVRRHLASAPFLRPAGRGTGRARCGPDLRTRDEAGLRLLGL